MNEDTMNKNLNPRLKELYAQAAEYALGLCGVADPNGPREIQGVVNEKFAELIIQKVIELCHEEELVCEHILNSNEMGNKPLNETMIMAQASMMAAYKTMPTKLKDYFGVE